MAPTPAGRGWADAVRVVAAGKPLVIQTPKIIAERQRVVQ